MDQGGLKLEPEVQEVLKHALDGSSFLLSGGAGSGKTYSLVQVIGELLRTDLSAFIACITYTNAAVREIEFALSATGSLSVPSMISCGVRSAPFKQKYAWSCLP